MHSSITCFILSFLYSLVIPSCCAFAPLLTPGKHTSSYSSASKYTKLSASQEDSNEPESNFLLKNPFRSFQQQNTVNDDKDQSSEQILESLGLKNDVTPKSFGIAPGQFLNVATATLPTIIRGGSGLFADGYKISIIPKDDNKYTLASIGNYQIKETCSPTIDNIDIQKLSTRDPLIIYEFEACPFCRKVREAVSILALDVEFRPCPKNGSTFRKEIKETYGDRATFPFLKDPNTGVEMFESDDIIQYLFTAYGDGVVPISLSGGFFTALSGGVALLSRLGNGGSRENSNPPELPLILWAHEGSPFCKLVRERLCEYQIAHVQKSCPRGSSKREILFQRTGTFQDPYLEDPNNGVALFESSAILEYLLKMYGVEPSPVQYL